jgi:SAM-dependent methyltransferase
MIGRAFATTARSAAERSFVRLFGTADFHTHLRLAWMRSYRMPPGSRLCELGAGSGIGLVELLLRNPGTTASGYEVDHAAVAAGTSAARALGLQSRLALHVLDREADLPVDIDTADHVLLLDVLEHLPEPAATAAAIAERIKPGARVLVSVPTPLYPGIFGRRFHTAIGHLHEGFSLRDVDRWFAGLDRVRFRYSTGPLTWPGVVLYYRLGSHGHVTGGILRRAANALATVLSLPFRWLDAWNGRSVSCSLFAEYVKPHVAGRQEGALR